MNETDTTNITIVKESYSDNQSDSDSVSWHCGCPCDPWPDDIFKGYGPPDPEYEKNYELKKDEGLQHHICGKQRRTKKKAKKLKKAKKTKRAEKANEANRIAEEDKGF